LPRLSTQKWALIATALAGLAGGGGVILSAAAAHGSANPMLQTAAYFLMLHAVATIAVCSLALAAPQRGAWFLGAAAVFLLGGALFAGDLSARALAGARLFPMAAPIGGTLLILGWAFVVIAALLALAAKRTEP
jgi:uncharacterized membrane protein YgdD (TMEM256/DUF423 family)